MLTEGKFPFVMKILQTGKCVFELQLVDESKLLVQPHQKQYANELIVQMIDSDTAKRPSLDFVENHVFFQDACNHLQFLMDVCKFLETKSTSAKILEVMLNIQPATVIHGNWFDILEPELVEDLKKRKIKNQDNVTDLIRYIRNKWMHSGEWNKEIKIIFGPTSETYLNYWCKTFPKLWKHLHLIVEENLTFFDSTFQQSYSNIQNPSSLRNSLNLINMQAALQNIDFTKPDGILNDPQLTDGTITLRPRFVLRQNSSQQVMNYFAYEDDASKLIIKSFEKETDAEFVDEIENLRSELDIKLSTIKTLHLKFCKIDSNVLVAILESCFSIRKLFIHYTTIIESQLKLPIERSLSHLQSISNLSIKSCDNIPKSLFECKNLQWLELEDFPEHQLVEHLLHQKNLHTLLLSTSFDSKAWENSQFQLHTLNLDLWLDCEEKLNNFLGFMKTQKSIECLSLKFTKGIDQHFLNAILNFALHELTFLHELELYPFPRMFQGTKDTFNSYCLYFDSCKTINFSVKDVKIMNCDEKSLKKMKKKTKKIFHNGSIHGLVQKSPKWFENLVWRET